MPGTDPAAERALLLEAAEAAASIARRHFGQAPEVWDKPGEGPVTAADLEVDRMLRAELLAARPGYGWLSEETPDSPARLEAERVFIVDPIDGTRAFIDGATGWAHSLALAERGRVVAAVVRLPMLDRVFAAHAGGGATLNGAAITPSVAPDPKGARVLTNAAGLSPAHWKGGVPEVARHFRPSLAHRLCLVAEGAFDAMLTFRDAWEWDVAAGDLIAREAGGTVTTRDGTAPRYNRAHPKLPGLIAAGPALHAALMARL